MMGMGQQEALQVLRAARPELNVISGTLCWQPLKLLHN